MTATLTNTLRVANLADLTDVHVSPLQNGSQCWVDNEYALFILLKASSSIPDGITVVAPRVGSPIAGGATSVWVRINSAPTTMGVWVLPGSSKDAELSALVAAGFRALLVDDGNYGLDAPVTGFVTGSGLITPEWTVGAHLIPNYVGGGASDPTNALVQVVSPIGAALGTLAATSEVDDKTLTCTANVPAGTWILSVSDRTTFDWYTNVGIDVIREEVVQVLSSTPSGPNFVLALDRPLAQNHRLRRRSCAAWAVVPCVARSRA